MKTKLFLCNYQGTCEMFPLAAAAWRCFLISVVLYYAYGAYHHPWHSLVGAAINIVVFGKFTVYNHGNVEKYKYVGPLRRASSWSTRLA